MAGNHESLSALALLLSRSAEQRDTFRDDTRYPVERRLLKLFDVAVEPGSDVPVGAFTRYLIKGDVNREHWCMRADPVYIQPNRDHLLLMGNAGIDFSFDDAQRLVNDINTLYADTHWHLTALTPRQWLLEQENAATVNSHSLSQAVGKNIKEFLPDGAEAKQWHAIMNELQMFLHSHPLNQQRQMQGKSVINSIWFWGAGVLPANSHESKQPPYAQCWSDEPLSLSLAKLTGVPRADLPASAMDWLRHAITAGSHFLMLEHLHNDEVRHDPLTWWQALTDFNNDWLAPLIEALRKNEINELVVIGDERVYQLTRRLSNRWWKWITPV